MATSWGLKLDCSTSFYLLCLGFRVWVYSYCSLLAGRRSYVYKGIQFRAAVLLVFLLHTTSCTILHPSAPHYTPSPGGNPLHNSASFSPSVCCCQDPYFHTLTTAGNVMSSLILLCSSGLPLGLRPLLSSPARAILTQYTECLRSAAFLCCLLFSCFLVCSSLVFAGGLLMVLGPGDLVHSTDESSVTLGTVSAVRRGFRSFGFRS
jgi:hypothetical protein